MKEETHPQPIEQPQQSLPVVPDATRQQPVNTIPTESFFIRHKWIVAVLIVLLSLLTILIIFANDISQYITSKQFLDNTDPKIIAKCKEGGGKWTNFSNGCGNSCSSVKDKVVGCTQANQWNCDCGDDKCWDGEECVINPAAENDADINKQISNSNDVNNIGCTEEAKMCPDGSTVGRVPPDCEFESCLSQQPQNTTPTLKTYTSIENKYSINYPSDQYVQLVCPGENSLILSKRRKGDSEDIINKQSCGRDSKFNFELITADSPFHESVYESYAGKYYTIKKTDIIVDGVKARQYYATFTGLEGSPAAGDFIEIFCERNGKYYNLHLDWGPMETLLPYFLSSFKFQR